jgi:Tfp pilus assembly protein PilO
MRSKNFRSLIAEIPLLVIASGAAALVLALVHFVMVPQAAELKKQRIELQRYQTLISSENGFVKIKQDLTAKIDTLRSRLIRSRTDLKRDSADLGGYLEVLIGLAKKNDIRFARIQPQAESQSADYTVYPVMFVLTTTYHSLGRFLSELEKVPDLYSVDRIALDAAPDEKCTVHLLVSCLIPREKRL